MLSILAIEEWDKEAEGDFVIFVNKYVTALWEAMARLNWTKKSRR